MYWKEHCGRYQWLERPLWQTPGALWQISRAGRSTGRYQGANTVLKLTAKAKWYVGEETCLVYHFTSLINSHGHRCSDSGGSTVLKVWALKFVLISLGWRFCCQLLDSRPWAEIVTATYLTSVPPKQNYNDVAREPATGA